MGFNRSDSLTAIKEIIVLIIMFNLDLVVVFLAPSVLLNLVFDNPLWFEQTLFVFCSTR